MRKIEKNKQGTVFVLDYTGVISGVITDGDLRRWFTLSDNPDLSNLASLAMNTNYVSRKINDSQELIHATLSDQIKIIPLLNSNKQLEAVVINGNLSIEIGEYVLSEDSPCFVIAEVGNNHNGDISLAKQLVDLAVDSGADCVKFQMRDLNSLYKNQGNKNDYSADLGAQSTTWP